MIGYTGPWQGGRAGGGGSDAPNHERKGGDRRGGKEGGEIKGVKEKRKVREKEENKRTFIINSLNRKAVRLRRRPRSVWASAALLTPTSRPKLLSPLLTFGCIHIHLFSAPRYPLSGLTPERLARPVSSSHLPLPFSTPPSSSSLLGPPVKYELPVAYWSHA